MKSRINVVLLAAVVLSTPIFNGCSGCNVKNEKEQTSLKIMLPPTQATTALERLKELEALVKGNGAYKMYTVTTFGNGYTSYDTRYIHGEVRAFTNNGSGAELGGLEYVNDYSDYSRCLTIHLWIPDKKILFCYYYYQDKDR